MLRPKADAAGETAALNTELPAKYLVAYFPPFLAEFPPFLAEFLADLAAPLVLITAHLTLLSWSVGGVDRCGLCIHGLCGLCILGLCDGGHLLGLCDGGHLTVFLADGSVRDSVCHEGSKAARCELRV
jgi:hypothetical protein